MKTSVVVMIIRKMENICIDTHVETLWCLFDKKKWNIHTCWLIIYCITVSFEEEGKAKYFMTIGLRLPYRTNNPPVEATT